ncbi:MAG: PIN domain-containing protein [Leptolyngbyaceae cyanobacterium bins.349]|nr:PIN domain-containing protein [Leptolyngbyaceae cyanobacterium bins.349]
MALLPPVLILFDTTALLAGRSLEWQEFARLGECYLPEAVLEQIEFMCDRASEPEVESKAREFSRFYPNSGWKRTGIQAEHPTLKPAPGHALSKRARLALTVSSCAYGMALRYPSSLVVVVANDQPMLQQVLGLQLKNLCGMPYTALIQWVRVQRRPPVINHHLQLMRTVTPNADSAGQRSAPGTPGVKSAHPRAAPSTHALSTTPGAYTAKRQRSYARSRRWSSLVSSFVSLVILLGAIATIWHILSPASFNQFWRSLPLVGTPR